MTPGELIKPPAPGDEYRLTAAGQARADAEAHAMRDLYREALERLADEDTPVLGEGLGGGPQEELHVRASFAAHTLGRDTCGCTECRVSLGLDDDGLEVAAARDEDEAGDPYFRQGKKLAIALDALRAVADEPHVGYGPERAATALAAIAELDL